MLPDGVKRVCLILRSNLCVVECLCLGLCILVSLLLSYRSSHCEGELPDAGKDEQDRHESDCAFTLHVFYKFKIIISVQIANKPANLRKNRNKERD